MFSPAQSLSDNGIAGLKSFVSFHFVRDGGIYFIEKDNDFIKLFTTLPRWRDSMSMMRISCDMQFEFSGTTFRS